MNGASEPGTANLLIGFGVNGNLIGSGGARVDANQEIGGPGCGLFEDPWHSRGYLPHCESVGAIQHVTFHLADSLPKAALERLEIELKSLPPKKQAVERRKRIEAWVDAGHGSCFLREPVIAKMVQTTLLHFDGQHYSILAWVVMPNHVHALVERKEGWTIGKIVASWKKFTARKICEYLKEANREIGAPGVWHREYWDRYMRNEDHLREMIDYIHQNPVKAGLTRRAEAWTWSSAHPGPPISRLASPEKPA